MLKSIIYATFYYYIYVFFYHKIKIYIFKFIVVMNIRTTCMRYSKTPDIVGKNHFYKSFVLK